MVGVWSRVGVHPGSGTGRSDEAFLAVSNPPAVRGWGVHLWVVVVGEGHAEPLPQLMAWSPCVFQDLTPPSPPRRTGTHRGLWDTLHDHVAQVDRRT